MRKVKLIVLTVVLTFIGIHCNAQNKIYDETLDAMTQIAAAVDRAQIEGKQVLCQVGGNWCPWCLRFAEFATTDTVVSRIIDENFVYIHVNWSRDNKNPEAMLYLGNPARFGFPVFVILDREGIPIHIQASNYLEEGKGYNRKLVAEFLLNWTISAVNTLK